MKSGNLKTEGIPAQYQGDWTAGYRQPHWKKPHRDNGRRRSMYRLGVALLIFVLFLGIKETSHPWGVGAREQLRYVLTTEWNYQPVFERVVQYGLQMADIERTSPETPRPVFSGSQQEDENASLPVPVSGRVVRGYGMVMHPIDDMERFSPGIVIEAPVGSAVRVVMDGQVKKMGESSEFGKYVLIEHGKGSYSLYGRLVRATVEAGQAVKAGQIIGEIGPAGNAAGGRLYFELRENYKLVDPLIRLQAN